MGFLIPLNKEDRTVDSVGNRAKVDTDKLETGHRPDQNPGHLLKGAPPRPLDHVHPLSGLFYKIFFFPVLTFEL